MEQDLIELDIERFSAECDDLIIANDLAKLRIIAEEYESHEYIFEHKIYEAQYYYVMGNVLEHINTRDCIAWHSAQSSMPLIAYRRSLYILNSLPAEVFLADAEMRLKACIYTNLANYLSNQYRFLEAIPLFEQAIELSESTAHLGYAVNQIALSSALFDSTHQKIHYKRAYQICTEAIKSIPKLHPEHVKTLEDGNIIRPFYNWYKDNLLLLEIKNPPYEEKYNSNSERHYLHWCGRNKLFLNDINDISDSPEYFYDSIDLPSFSYTHNPLNEIEDDLIFHSSFDEIKSCFLYSRYLAYLSNKSDLDTSKKNHIAFNTYSPIDSLDSSFNSIESEHLKSSFLRSYSIFDKIAYFICKFFNIQDKPDHQISFDSIFKKNKLKQGKFEPNPEIININNKFIIPLFLILKEIPSVKFENETIDHKRWKDKNRIELCRIRNSIEHQSIKIYEDRIYIKMSEKRRSVVENSENSPLKAQALKMQDYAVKISFEDFQKQNMTLLKLAREAIIYLSLAINLDQKNKDRSNKEDGPIVIRTKVPRKSDPYL